MQANQLAFIPRNRSSWEIFELTQLLVKDNYLALMKITCLLYLPVAALLWLCFSPTVAGTILWWLKPLLERPLLDYLSKRNFSLSCSTWQSIKSLKNLPIAGMLLNLSVFRFSPNRAYLSSVSQLENLKGSAKKKREATLLLRFSHHQTRWATFCVHLEILITCTVIALIYSIVPEGINIDQQFETFNLEQGILAQCYFVATVTAMVIVAPYFVTGGFLSYLHCRIKLEAWDLELAFKKIAQRFNAITLVALLIFSGAFSYAPSTTAAQAIIESQQQSIADEPIHLTQLRQQIEDIYQQNNLISKQKIWLPDQEKTAKDQTDPSDFKNMLDAINWLVDSSTIISNIVIAILITFLAWVIYKVVRATDFKNIRMRKVQLRQVSNNELPSFITANDIQSWPVDLLIAAERSLAQKDGRTALTYLLKYALELADKQVDVAIHPSMTEFECEVALLRELPQRCHASYQQLFKLWVQQAWAHRDADLTQIKKLIDVFRQGFAAEITT